MSGFLVGGLLFAELRKRGSVDIGRFLIRRLFKIWPSYFFYLLILAGLFQTGLGHAFTRRRYLNLGSLIPNLMHLQNYLGTGRGHTWSLAVEEHYYLALPLVVAALGSSALGRRLGLRRSIPWLAVFLMIACTAARLAILPSSPYDKFTHYYPTHLRIDGLVFGTLLAYWYHFHGPAVKIVAARRRILGLAALALVVPFGALRAEAAITYTVGYTMLYLGYGCLLLSSLGGSDPEPKVRPTAGATLARACASVGVVSYPVYLWHIDLARNPLIGLVVDMDLLGSLASEARWIVAMSLFAATSVVTGAVMARIIERPSLALRDRLFPGHATSLGAEAPVPARLGPCRPRLS